MNVVFVVSLYNDTASLGAYTAREILREIDSWPAVHSVSMMEIPRFDEPATTSEDD